MMIERLITLDDFIDVYSKARQRGAGFIFSKFNLKGESRTKSAFNESAIESSNWWIIPKVLERWNTLITGNPNTLYEAFMMDTYFGDSKDLRLLSLGSGLCTHEITLAAYPQFKEIVCVDLAANRLEEAKTEAQKQGLDQMKFVCQSIYEFPFEEEAYDMVLFNASLHHFKQVPEFLEKKILPSLKPSGKLVINEYVGPNRLQFPKHQIQHINKALQGIPSKFRTRFKLKLKKNRFRGSGWIRMYLADPSECVDSASILPSIKKHCRVVVEKPYGGNLLMSVLKDVAHHFVTLTPEKEAILEALFALEDAYLLEHPSDFVFGIYEKR